MNKLILVFALVCLAVAYVAADELECNTNDLATKAQTECRDACSNQMRCIRALNLLEEESARCGCDHECSNAINFGNNEIAQCLEEEEEAADAEEEEEEEEEEETEEEEEEEEEEEIEEIEDSEEADKKKKKGKKGGKKDKKDGKKGGKKCGRTGRGTT